MVLVADDNADMREHIETILSGKFNVVTAVNGGGGVRKDNGAETGACVKSFITDAGAGWHWAY